MIAIKIADLLTKLDLHKMSYMSQKSNKPNKLNPMPFIADIELSVANK